MSLTHNYRKIENRFFLKISAFFSTAFKRVRVRLNKLSRLLGRRYTVMVIPHTEKRPSILKFHLRLFLCYVLLS